MSHRQIVAFDKARVDRLADRRLLELCGNGLLSAKDYLRGDRHNSSFLSMFDHLRIEQFLWRNQDWLSWSSSLASLGKLVSDAIDRKQSVIIVVEFVRSEKRDLPIRPLSNASY